MELSNQLVVKRPQHGQAIKTVLKVLGGGSLFVAGLVVPNAAGAFAPLVSKRGQLPLSQTERALRYALSRGWVMMRETPRGTEIALSDHGRLKWQRVILDQPLTSRRWDGRWRVIIFDIPDKRKLARDAFRYSLKQLGCRQLQESVWITPHDCAKQVLALRELYGIGPFVRLIEAAELEGDKQLKTVFNLV